MAALSAIYGRILDVCGTVAAAFIFAMTALIVCDVALRNLTPVVIRGSVELTEYALFFAATFAAPWLLRQGKHIRIDILLTHLPSRAGWACELIADVIGIGLCLLLTWYSIVTLVRSIRAATLLVKDYIILEWWVQWPLPLMFVLLTIEFLFRIYRLVTGPRHARHEGERI
jgi:TRAP-type C4-dicarboxylate transport system permease small subunit